MYLVDTSVWIHALRPTGHPEIQARLKPLIIDGHTAVTEWILLELMTGLAQSEQPSSLLQHGPGQFPDRHSWHAAGRLRKSGVSPSAADCLIATIATEHQVTLIHCDRDFESMKPTLPLQTLDWTEYLRTS